MKKEKKPHIYCLHLTEKQLKTINQACNHYSRLICGQDFEFRDLFEQAWEKRCKLATGELTHKSWAGGWRQMRERAEKTANDIKRDFWGLDYNTLNGIYYDDTADLLFELHQVIRHQLWLDRPENQRSTITVDSDTPMSLTDEPFAYITKE